jgi:flagellin-like protein
MKANQRFVNDDEAVSPVIAVILMVAITVVLAATVYLWVSGFGTNQSNLVQASFAARAVDVPTAVAATADADTTDDAIEITYTSGASDLAASDVIITIDGVSNTGGATVADRWGACTAAGDLCSSAAGPGGDQNFERGESIFLWLFGASATAPGDWTCAGTCSTHLLKVSVRGQVVLDTSIEVHDNGAA